MYFSISKQNFYKPLDYISGPAQGAGQDSINGNVLLNVIKNNNLYPNIDSQYVLELVCTDNDIEMKSIIGIYSDEVVEGGITVKVKSLLDIIKSFEDETFITIKYDESELEKDYIECGEYLCSSDKLVNKKKQKEQEIDYHD